MKKTCLILAALIAVVFLFTSCQKAKEPEKKEAQVQQAQKEEAKQPIEAKPLETKPEIQPAQQQPPAPTAKEEKRETVETEPTVLTEQEQKEFSQWRDRWDGQSIAYLNEKDAAKYLGILMKGRFELKWYADNKAWGTGTFEDDVCALFSYLAGSKNEEGYRLAVEVLEKPDKWWGVLKCVLRSMKTFDKKESIPFVRKFLNYQLSREMFHGYERQAENLETDYKLEAARTLLMLGDADTALPALDELAQSGYAGALYSLFSGPGKIIDERGYAIVEKALDNPKAEVRISAVKLLLESKKITKDKAEDVALATLTIFKSSKEYGIGWDNKRGIIPLPGFEKDFEKSNQQQGSDWRAIETAISILAELKSKKAIPALEKLAKNPDASYLKRRANNAIKTIMK